MNFPDVFRPAACARAVSITAAVLLVALGAATPAPAATYSYSDSQCASFTLSNPAPGTFVVSCAKLSCSINSSPAGTSLSPLNASTTLTASCSPTADQGFVWSAGSNNQQGCPAAPSTSLATQTLTGTGTAVSGCVYQAAGTSSSNGGGSATITLSWSATPPPAAPTCGTPTISPSTLTSAGGPVNLGVSCTASAAITYEWFRNGVSWSTLQSPSETLPANTASSAVTTSYQVKACSGGSCTALLPTPPLAATVPGTGLGTGSTNLCAAQGFSKTIYYTWNWANGNLVLDTVTMRDQAGGTGIGTNGILVVAFTPTSPADVDNLGKISITEYPGNSLVTQRTLAISTQPCDLVGLVPSPSASTAPTLQYGVGTVTNSLFSGKPKGVAVTPGTQYFINVAGRSNVSAASPGGTQSCFPSSSQLCDVRASLFKPAGH